MFIKYAPYLHGIEYEYGAFSPQKEPLEDAVPAPISEIKICIRYAPYLDQKQSQLLNAILFSWLLNNDIHLLILLNEHFKKSTVKMLLNRRIDHQLSNSLIHVIVMFALIILL